MAKTMLVNSKKIPSPTYVGVRSLKQKRDCSKATYKFCLKTTKKRYANNKNTKRLDRNNKFIRRRVLTKISS
jgi:hypothetical protein